MKAIGWFLVVFLGLLAQHGAAQWNLIWADDFAGTALDTKKWDYEVDCWGGGNNENQCYVTSTNNVYVRDGVLNIKPIYHPNGYQGSIENCTNNNDNSCTWTRPVTSGRIRTLKAVDGSWTYGRFEIRAKMPVGDFLWPAIWMLPTFNKYGTWAASGEIDIQEFRGQDPYISEHTLHFGGVWPCNLYEGSGPIWHSFNLTSDFHVYATEWDASEMRWYVDSSLMRTATLERSFCSWCTPCPYTGNRQPFDDSFHMILNLAIGGNFFPADRYGYFDPPNDSKTWTQPFQIDYVRIWKRA